jgi:hypothetical protein
VNRAPDEGEEVEGADEDESAPKSGLAARLSGPVAGVKGAYQKAASKLTPATAVVIDDVEEPAPKYLDGPGAAVDEAEAEVDTVVEETEEELEVEAAELAPVVVLPDPEEVGDGLEPEATEDDTLSVVVLPEEETEPAEVVTARRVRKVVRRIDPLSVLKLSFVFYLCLFVIVVIAGLLLWSMAVNAGDTIDNLESFIVDIGFEDFEFVAGDLLRGLLVFGAVLVVVGTVVTTLLAILFNLISDLVGGIRYTVIEPVEPDPEPVPEHD